MAIGTKLDFTIYNEQFWTGVTEILQQKADVFNERSRGALRLITDMKLGEYDKETFLKSLSAGGIAERDPTVTTDVADTATQQGEHVGVKVNRRFGPVADTLDKWKKIGSDLDEFALLLGRQRAEAILVDQVNTLIRALKAAITNQAGLTEDRTLQAQFTNITHQNLAKALRKFGDAADRVIAWVGHSASAHDLLEESIANGAEIESVAGLAIVQGNIATLGRPFIMTDSAALFTDATRDAYTVLGLTEMAGEVAMSEDQTVVIDVVTGKENLVYRVQGEYAYNLKLKGYTWDVQNGGSSPGSAALGTGSNWDKVASDDKDTAGVALIHHLRDQAIAS